MAGMLEHVNITVSDPEATALWLRDVFGWKLRWKGTAIHGGTTYHVGNETSYLAIYSRGGAAKRFENDYRTVGGLNHVGIAVEDLDAIEQRVLQHGFQTHSHADYEPGRRFYFDDGDGIEFEVVSYANKAA
ncbi:MAG: VOC family protein [Rhizobiales bacterium]|nr:VOC family protein [Hyphomicrobiales bacterium]